MLLTIKTTKGKVFKIDIELDKSVGDLKQQISDEQGHPAPAQKIIFSGKILADDKPLNSCGIKENDFLVLMVSTPKPTPQAPTSTPSSSTAAAPPQPTPPPVAGQVAPEPAPAASVPIATPPAQPVSSPVPATTTTAGAGFGDMGSFLTGEALQTTITNMEEMGFERAQILRALKASFNNPDRAVEYLMNGIPDNIDAAPTNAGPSAAAAPAPQPAQTAPPSADAHPVVPSQAEAVRRALNPSAVPPQAAAAPVPAPAPAATNTSRSGPQNLFQLAQQQQQQQHLGHGGAPGFAPGLGALGDAGGAGDLEGNPRIAELRNLVMQNPTLLQPMVQQIAQANPELAQYLETNPEALLQMLGSTGADFEEGDGEEGGPIPPGAQVLHVTPEERAAIERLEALGFTRRAVVEAFFACDKNEEMAANYLFETQFQD